MQMEIKKMKEKIDTESKNFLLNKSKEKFMNEEKPMEKAKTIAVAGGGLLRQKYRIGDEVGLNEDDIPELEEAPPEG